MFCRLPKPQIARETLVMTYIRISYPLLHLASHITAVCLVRYTHTNTKSDDLIHSPLTPLRQHVHVPYRTSKLTLLLKDAFELETARQCHTGQQCCVSLPKHVALRVE